MVPTFRWDDNADDAPTTFTNRRHSAGLRIYLNGRWFSSGDDELLGVVISQANDVSAILQDEQKRTRIPVYNPLKDSPEEQFVSSWGGDPVFKAQRSVEQLYLTDWESSNCPPCVVVPSRRAVDRRLEPETGGACGWNLTVPGVTGTRVAVVGYKPCFDDTRKLWYCDISFSQAPRYGVFVRLVLARYQPHALPGFELSTTVAPGFSQLNPDRTLIVRPKKIQRNGSEEDGISITIWGIPNPGGLAGANEFEVYLERGNYSGTESLGWERDMAVNKSWSENKDSGEQVIWYGEVIPDPCAKRRIMVLEFEKHEADGESGPIPSRRLVYADAVEIN